MTTPNQPLNQDEQHAAAYTRYNASYSNETYRAIQTTLVREVCGAYQAQEPALLERALNLSELNAIMQSVTDASLELCGHPDHQGAGQALLRAVVRQPVTVDTLHAIVRHWDNFVDDEETRCAAFLASGQAALHLHSLVHQMPEALSLTSDLPSSAGNVAHLLIQSAFRLLRAAELVLVAEPSRAYIQEQMRVAETGWHDARHLLDQMSANDGSEA